MKRPLVLAAIGALAACGGDGEKLAPVPSAPTSANAGGASPTEPVVPAIPGRVKRTVMERNPFGGTPNNLLADGDFELSTVPHNGAQLGWRAYTADGSTGLDTHFETGGLCRSGLHCLILDHGMLLLGRGTSAWNKGNVAAIWVKPPPGASCNEVRTILVSCDSNAVDKVLSAKKQGADGWCQYTASLSPQDSATCMYVDNTLKEGTYALVDAALIGPDDGTVYPDEAQFWVPDASTAAALENLHRLVQSTMPVGRARRARPSPR